MARGWHPVGFGSAWQPKRSIEAPWVSGGRPSLQRGMRFGGIVSSSSSAQILFAGLWLERWEGRHGMFRVGFSNGQSTLGAHRSIDRDLHGAALGSRHAANNCGWRDPIEQDGRAGREA
jgi:hypothetical protein